MAVTDKDLELTAEYVKTNITKGQLGLSDINFIGSQTSLINPILATKLDLTNIRYGNTVSFEYILPENVANDNSFREFELIDVDGNMRSRSTGFIIDKTSNQKIKITTYREYTTED